MQQFFIEVNKATLCVKVSKNASLHTSEKVVWKNIFVTLL